MNNSPPCVVTEHSPTEAQLPARRDFEVFAQLMPKMVSALSFLQPRLHPQRHSTYKYPHEQHTLDTITCTQSEGEAFGERAIVFESMSVHD